MVVAIVMKFQIATLSTYREKILDIINSVKDKNVPHKAKDGE